MRIFVLVAMMLFGTVSSAWTASDEEPAVFFDRSREGWFWYLRLPPELQEKAPLPDALPPTMQEMRARADELLSRAIETPTEVNVATYMSYQQRLTNRAEQFARIWQRVLWAHPELDPTVGEPVAAAGLSAMQAQQAADQDHVLSELAKTSGILYFYKGGCALCSAEAPLLSSFAETHGFRVIAISLDGSTDPMFPQSRMDYGAGDKLGVKTVPAVFLARPPNEVQRIGTGFLTIEELTRRLLRIARPMPQDAGVTSISELEENSHEEYEAYRLPESDHRASVEFNGPGQSATATR